MSATLASLAQRRARLLHKVAADRRLLCETVNAWRRPLAMLGLACSTLRFVRLHPLAVACGYGVLRLAVPGAFERLARWRYRLRQVAVLLAGP